MKNDKKRIVYQVLFIEYQEGRSVRLVLIDYNIFNFVSIYILTSALFVTENLYELINTFTQADTDFKETEII